MVTGHYPLSIDEALQDLTQYEDTLLINGGTDTMVVKKEAGHVIFLNRIASLKEVEKGEAAGREVLRIGAGVTYYNLLQNPLVPDVLKQAIMQIASPAIRHMGTMAGNICNASPAGDTLPVLYALSAKIILASCPAGKTEYRKVPIEDFIRGIRKTALKAGELVTAIELETAAYENTNRCLYQKVGARKSEAISKLSFIGLAQVDGNKLKKIRIAFGSVGITTVRRKEIEAALIGMNVEEIKQQKEAIVEQYEAFINPIDDQRSTAHYRKTVCLNLLKSFLSDL